jgi:hypothetical protein
MLQDPAGLKTRRMARLRRMLAAPMIVFLALAGWFISSRSAWLDFPLDDAWIHRVYARALASGQGFAYNTGQPEAGSTSPLWAILTAPAHWAAPLNPDLPVILVKVTGLLLGLGAVILAALIARRLTHSTLAGALTAMIFALDPRLYFSSLSGMETNLLAVCWLGMALAWQTGRYKTIMILAGLAPVIRPEAVILLPMAAAAARLARRAGTARLNIILLLAAAALPCVLWTSFCLNTTGHPLPNTFYLKAGLIPPGRTLLATAGQILSQHGWAGLGIFPIGLVTVFLFCWHRNRAGLPVLMLLIVLPAIYISSILVSRPFNPEGYYWTRWTDPAVLVLTPAFAMGITLLLSGMANISLPAHASARNQIIASGAGILLCLALLAFDAPGWLSRFRHQRGQFAADCHAIRTMDVAPALWIADHAAADDIIATDDAGAMRYFSQRRTIDLIGLNHADIAFFRLWRRQAIDEADWLVIFPEIFKTYLPFIGQRFEPCYTVRIPKNDLSRWIPDAQTKRTLYRRKTGSL